MESTSIHFFERPQHVVAGFSLPARMSVLALGAGELALVSPLSIDEELAEAIGALGEVRYLIAPNLLHHLHLASAMARFPEATLLAPPGLAAKRPELRIHGTLDAALPSDLAAHVEVVRLEGAGFIDEYALFHRESAALILTDLVFNVRAPQGFVTNLVLLLAGCRGRLGVSREWGFATKDREAMRASLARMMALPFSRLVVAHGEIVEVDARTHLEAALRRRFGANFV